MSGNTEKRLMSGRVHRKSCLRKSVYKPMDTKLLILILNGLTQAAIFLCSVAA